MKLFISRFFLITGLFLLLLHNIVAHHHDDEHEEQMLHHNHDVLEYVKIDHTFYTDYFFVNGLQALLPEILNLPDYGLLRFPVILPIRPQEPYPPGWIINKTILRGPPVNC